MEAFLVLIFVLIFSAILHEIAHGYVADKLGDPTAKIAGRLTLNPIPHLDPIMSVIVPFLLIASGSPIIFGGAKPVPVNPLMLKEGRKDVALVALSGPFTNLLLAIFGSVIFFLFFKQLGLYTMATIAPDTAFQINPFAFFFATVVKYNLILGFLNLLPIPPLDGSKFFSIIFPERTAQQYLSLAPFGIFILFLVLLATPLGDLLSQLVASSLHLLGM